MTTTSAAKRLLDPPEEQHPPRRDWRLALAGLRRLLRDNDDTVAVFDIMRSLNARSTHDGYLRLISGPVGARIAFEHRELEPLLMDDSWLDGFADGTVGAAYRGFVRAEQLSAAGLATVSMAGGTPSRLDAPDPIAWYRRRVRDVHDLWHTLTGYGRDPLGEACLVAFSYAQTRGLGWLLIALGAFAKGGSVKIEGVRAAIVEGYRHGRKASWLPGLDYEALMAMPLEDARRALGIAPPGRYDAVVANVEKAGLDLRDPFGRERAKAPDAIAA